MKPSVHIRNVHKVTNQNNNFPDLHYVKFAKCRSQIETNSNKTKKQNRQQIRQNVTKIKFNIPFIHLFYISPQNQADLFSLGMLFYHVISGLIPFDDESSIETKVNITTGNRPKFEHIEYAMLPRFAHLEALMKKCWQDSPIDRPSAQNALKVMQDASFLCLRHHVEVESESEACLYSQEAAAVQVK